VFQDLDCNPTLGGDGGDGNIGSVLSPHKECLIEGVELLKNGEGSSFLLTRDSVLRAASTTSPTRGCDWDGALPSSLQS
jgi:hypothetical protein